jgi:hypothetical protein
MKEQIQALIALAGSKTATPAKLLVAAAPIIQAVEDGAEIPDDAWLLLPRDLRAGILSLLVQLLLEAAAKK